MTVDRALQPGRTLVRLALGGHFDERDAAEMPMKGWRGDVWAELGDGSRHRLTFYDLARLTQTLEDDRRAGRPFFSEPGLVILPHVTLAAMEQAARALAADGFFEK
jgi:hypothetical protein